MKKKTVLSLIFGGFFLALIMAQPITSAFAKQNPAGKIVIRYGHVVPKFHHMHKGAVAMAEYVNKKSNGSIEIQIFPARQLGSTRTMIEAVHTGTIGMVAASVSELALYVPQLDLYSLPFVFPNRKVGFAVLKSEKIRAKLFPLLEKAGFIPLGFASAEPRDITNSIRPVRKPGDIKGMRIRVMEAPIYVDAWKQLGAVPISMPFGEVYTALQQGLADGQENPMDISAMMKFLEVNKFATSIGYALQTNPILINPALWKRLTDEQRQIMREGAAEEERVMYELGTASLAKGTKVAKEKYNVSVVELTPAERAAFQKAVKPVYDKYRKSIKPEYFNFFMKEVDNIAKELGY